MRRISPLAFAITASLSIAEAADTATFVVPAGEQVSADYERIADYGSYGLYRGSAGTLPTARGAYALNEADVLQFDRMHLDTQRATMQAPPGFALAAPVGAALQLVQFVGPIKDQWLDQLRASGAVPVHYIESNGYLVWAGAPAREALARLAADRKVLQYSAPLPSFIKLGTSLFERLQRDEDRGTSIRITLQLYRHAGNVASKRALEAMGLKPDGGWTELLAYENAHFTVTLAQARAIIEFADVVWIGEVHPRSLHDEVQAQIIRGYFNAQQSGPQAEGYLQWLDALGFPSDPTAYPLLDITDDGVGNRTTTTGDPSLHVLGDVLQASRVVYNQSCGNPAFNGVVKGHGHLDASIAVGYDVRANANTPGARFPGAYQRGLGMNPYGRIGATRIFNSNNSFDITACGDSETGLIRANYLAGARISTNSWGCNSCAGQYDDTSQAYDVGTRDADLQMPGNQQLITLFSAGNNGSNPGTVSAPGNGKNMITVGAAENQRRVDENGNWNDGCGNGPNNADNAMDIVGFSARGPSPGARVKPEFVAPGTHVTGTRATPGTGTSLCDGSRPSGNATYAASSGTSHATPALAGVASLVYWWITNARGALAFDGGAASTPTPALIKAWMMAHPTYLTGVSANDTLPSNAQGFGMPNLQAMFGDTATYLVNQTQLLTDSGQVWTWSGAVADPAKPLRVALAWTDAPGAIGSNPQVNNLDLEVQVGATTYRGNRFTGQWSIVSATPDNKNNYEAVYLPAGTNNTVTIRIKAFNIAGDGVPGNADVTDQDFAVVCSNCAQAPTFSLQVDPPSLSVCGPATASVPFTISASSIFGFNTPVDLAVSGNPPGTTASFSPANVILPASSVLTVGSLGSAAAGSYALSITGSAGAEVVTRPANLTVYTTPPSTFAAAIPADGTVNAALRPQLAWAGSTQASNYLVEIARDAGFLDVIYTAGENSTTHAVATPLAFDTRYFWRVKAANPCGDSTTTTVFSFRTMPVPGECPFGSVPVTVYATDFEGDNTAWTSAGHLNTWAISSARTHSGTRAFLAQDVTTASDQRLLSPVISLPTGQSPLSLQFWNHQTIEDRIGGCRDGALLEISSNAGITWTPVTDAEMLAGAYAGPIEGLNPAAGMRAWCGDPQDWTRTIVDLDSHAGQNLQLRFRMATDETNGRLPDGFYLDDLLIQSCGPPGDAMFAHGFE